MRLDPNKWYFTTYAYIAAFLCIGPLALPLVWINPRYDTGKKVLITALTLIASFIVAAFFAKSVGSITEYYRMAFQIK